MESEQISRDFGPQPLDAIMSERGIGNHVLVDASGEHLTHKEVAKGRKGRRLTPNLMGKITRAMNLVAPNEPAWLPSDLFNYAGEVRKSWGARAPVSGL